MCRVGYISCSSNVLRTRYPGEVGENALHFDGVPFVGPPQPRNRQPNLQQKEHFMSAAAKGSRLLSLQWARQPRYPWDQTISDAAAEGGLAVLQ